MALELTRGGNLLRLRATIPDATGTWRQQRIATRFLWPDGLDGARAMAEQLGRDIRCARMGDPFPIDRWLGDRPPAAGETISGHEAMERTERHWRATARNPSNEETWRSSYYCPLKSLLTVEAITAQHLRALVMRSRRGGRQRQRIASAAAVMAQALGMGAELAAELRELGRGYTAQDAAPRDLPSDAVIEGVLDGLSDGWQWVGGICATYGARPHEALHHATVQPTGLLVISDGKTGPRQALPLPKSWIERWDLERKRLPPIDLNRSHKVTGRILSIALRRAESSFTGYDLRHAWAVRAIMEPRISPSLAAKSMGHSLTMHSQTYQRWFDQSSLLGVLEGL